MTCWTCLVGSDAVPLVELGAAPMQTRFGRKSKPVLKVVRWLNTAPTVTELVALVHDRPQCTGLWLEAQAVGIAQAAREDAEASGGAVDTCLIASR
jgi:hypothetical protein